jgi:hypothetical protein
MDLPSRCEPYKKNEIKTFPLIFQFFLANVRIESRTHCALCSGKDDGAIYIKITLATGRDDATMPVAYEDHGSNRLMWQYARCH